MIDNANFLIYTGADWTQQLVLQNDDKSPMDLTGCEAHMMVRAFPQSPVTILDLSTAAGTMTLTPDPAQLNWHIPASQTETFAPNGSPAAAAFTGQSPTYVFGYYDLMIEYPDGSIIPYMAGQILLQIGITHPF